MPIRDWPATERPREKLLHGGPSALSDAELLALFLGSGQQGTDAVQAARALLSQAGSLRELLDLPAPDMRRLPGLGPARTSLLIGALELGQRHLAAALTRGDALDNPSAAGDYFSRRLRARPQEVFAALFLDNRHRCLAFEELFNGTVNAATVHPREVVRRAIHHNAAALIVGHNHPSGDTEPSAADRHVTKQLAQALEVLDIRLLDHIIVGDGPAVSMAARGLM